jgi:superfamily II DNA or RNA helicase
MPRCAGSPLPSPRDRRCSDPHFPLWLLKFRPGRQQVVESLLAGRPTLAVFPTGGGKSLCYQLLDGVTVVVSPLIALMKDQIRR